MTQSYPRQQARTRRFRLGAPGHFHASPDGARVAFVRSNGGDDPVNRLVVGEITSTGCVERIVADPGSLLGGGTEDVPAAERARRERLRETTAGITTFATDTAVTVASFALSGRLGVAGLADEAAARLIDTPGGVIDPRVDPTGRQVAWVSDRTLWVSAIDGTAMRPLLEPETQCESWGVADFVAAEELDRHCGFWWAPDGSAILVARVDEEPVRLWWIATPGTPEAEPTTVRYPAAGTPNASVSLWRVSLDGRSRQVDWRGIFPEAEYLASVRWTSRGDALATLLNRAQTVTVTVAIGADGQCRRVQEATDSRWVEVAAGSPQWWAPDEMVTIVADAETDTMRLRLGAAFLTPPGLQVGELLDVSDDGFLVTGTTEPTRRSVLHVGPDGQITVVADSGWSGAVRSGDTLVVASSSWDRLGGEYAVLRKGAPSMGPGAMFGEVARISSLAQTPCVTPSPQLLRTGSRELRTVVLWPTGHERGSAKLPVLLNPYGGPRAQRVVASGLAFCEPQWLADQGFAVVVADGRGSPGRGPAFEREVFRDLAGPPLGDQVSVVEDLAARFPEDIDAGRVGITGWSFGGYLAALAVLRRPDVFHAAVAGAPVTDWRFYDTAYSERYLGDPDDDGRPYDACSLLEVAPGLRRPLLIIHGLADDNVFVAHSVKLSSALTAAGRQHCFLPLGDVTHMASDEVVAENLLLLQVRFLRQALGMPPVD